MLDKLVCFLLKLDFFSVFLWINEQAWDELCQAQRNCFVRVENLTIKVILFQSIYDDFGLNGTELRFKYFRAIIQK